MAAGNTLCCEWLERWGLSAVAREPRTGPAAFVLHALIGCSCRPPSQRASRPVVIVTALVWDYTAVAQTQVDRQKNRVA